MAGTKSAEERNQITGRLWQAAPLSAGQKLIPSSSPVPPTQGAGLARLAFCVSVRWREGQRTGKQRVAPAPVQLHRQTDGQMPCSSPVPYPTFATATGTSLGPRLCLVCGEGWKAPQPAVSTAPCGNGGDHNHCGSRVQGPLTESLPAWPGTQRSCRGSRGSLSYWWSKGRDWSLICSARSHRLPARSLGRGRGQGADVQ